MNTVITQQGIRVEIISQSELRDPLTVGAYVRAYCHIHGSDHQRSLSINRATGWGHCFNAACMATVLVAEWNPKVEKQKIHRWQARIMFPLTSPEGRGYIGRSLAGWRPGMDENRHKALLEQPGRPKRWIKTNPAGWFSCDLDQLSRCIILVEGGF